MRSSRPKNADAQRKELTHEHVDAEIAASGGPPSPEYPGSPVPTTVVIMPSALMRRTRWLRWSRMKSEPSLRLLSLRRHPRAIVPRAQDHPAVRVELNVGRMVQAYIDPIRARLFELVSDRRPVARENAAHHRLDPTIGIDPAHRVVVPVQQRRM